MEFSAEVLDGLHTAGDSVHIPDNTFPALLKYTCSCILHGNERSKSEDKKDFSSVEAAALKQSQASLGTLLLEAAKQDVDADSVGTLLEDCKFSPDRIQAFNTVYSENKQDLRVLLSSISSRYPHVVDVDWRLDYYIKNNHMEKVNEAVYMINLKTEETNSEDVTTIQFACTQDQLQDLVGKLKDACKSLDRATQE